MLNKRAGNYVELGHVHVLGNKAARSREEDPEMKSWRKISVLVPAPRTDVYPGFISAFSPIPQFYDRLVSGVFGMRLGPEDVIFVARAKDPARHVQLRLIDIADIDDPRYCELGYI